MNVPANLKYTKSDEWFDPASGAMGLSDYAQGQLSDIVFVEILVGEGRGRSKPAKPSPPLNRSRPPLRSTPPPAARSAAVNKDLSDKPETLNCDPYGEGWMIKVEGGAAGEVMDAAAYEKYCEERRISN